MSYYATKLINKKIVRIVGRHCCSFLQTLITNDLRYLFGHRNVLTPCIYSFISNTNGRSLADIFVYKPQPPTDGDSQRNLVLAPFHIEEFDAFGKSSDELLIECQADLARPLVNTLLAIKVKRELTAEIAHEMDLWTIYPETPQDLLNSVFIPEIQSDDVILSRDPRLPFLGYRLLTRLGAKSVDDVRKFLPSDVQLTKANTSAYEQFRYKLGVGEGEKDFPNRLAIPLECNGDMLNAISFRKGLYTGNDITSRNHRKGVKKRLLPVEFELPSGTNRTKSSIRLADYGVVPNTALLIADQPVGRIQATNGAFGLALLQMLHVINYAKNSGQDQVRLRHEASGLQLTARVPFWFRRDRPKIIDGRPGSWTLLPGRIGSSDVQSVVNATRQSSAEIAAA